MVSGTPQGTILGPILFVSYINHIADCVSSNIKLFADDTKIYRELRNLTSDIQMLQSDLDSLGHWANTVLCKSNESVIRRNSRISGLFDEKWRSFVHLESSKKIQRIFALPIVLVNANSCLPIIWPDFSSESSLFSNFPSNFLAKMRSVR